METAILAGGEIEDLIAFRPAEPSKWWSRKGVAQWLGSWEIGRRLVTAPLDIDPPALSSPHRTDDPLHVFNTPLEWLRNGGDGCVGLVPEAFADLLNVQVPLTYEDEAHQSRVESRMRFQGVLPEAKIRILRERQVA